MEDKFEKKLRELVPYIIVIAVLFLLLPLLMGTKETAVTYVIQLGAFPLISLGCGFHYTFRKHRKDLILCAIAPLFYAISALLYGMWRDSWITVLIYLAAYFICGYLGMLLCDLIKPGSKDKKPAQPEAPQRSFVRPSRVDVKKHEPEQTRQPGEPITEDPSSDISLDTSTTDDDIEAILRDIHNRRNQQ